MPRPDRRPIISFYCFAQNIYTDRQDQLWHDRDIFDIMDIYWPTRKRGSMIWKRRKHTLYRFLGVCFALWRECFELKLIIILKERSSKCNVQRKKLFLGYSTLMSLAASNFSSSSSTSPSFCFPSSSIFLAAIHFFKGRD